MDKDSVGIVETKFLNIDYPFVLESGKSLDNITVAYETYGDLHKWQKMALNNTAQAGYFCADRSIHEYAKNIWGLDKK